MPPQHENEMQFEDTENYSNTKNTYAEVILKHIARTIEEGSKEMTGGGTRTRILNGQTYDIYAPNQREIFINCVKMLHLSTEYKLQRKEDQTKKQQIEQLIKEYNQYCQKQKQQLQEELQLIKKREQTGNNTHNKTTLTQNYINLTEHKAVNTYRQIYTLLLQILHGGDFFGEQSYTYTGD